MTTKKKKSKAIETIDKIIGHEPAFGEHLQALRLAADQTLEEFGERLGLSRQKLCDIEKGRRHVTPEQAVRFAKTLGFSATTFVALALQDQVREAGLKLKVRVEAA